jgi:cob(I)alamin adenosyltransferase
LVFEQAAEALEQRLGFRVAEYGLRQAFVRVPDHPAAAGLRAGRALTRLAGRSHVAAAAAQV